MAKKEEQRIGKLSPRYSFILNPHKETRLSTCPMCEKATFERKFPLFIHVEKCGFLTLGITCKYCAKCELIMVHQVELEAALAAYFHQLAPHVVGNPYLVIGTMDKATWKQGLKGSGPTMEEALKNLADFKEVFELDFQPGGWYFDDEKK